MNDDMKKGIYIAALVCEDIMSNTIGNITAAQKINDSREAQTVYGIGLCAQKIRKILLGIIEGTEDLPRRARSE